MLIWLVSAPVIIIIVPPGLCVFSNGIGVVPITTRCLSQCCLAVSYIMVRAADCVVSSLCSCPLNMSACTSFIHLQTVSNLPQFLSSVIPLRLMQYICVMYCAFSPIWSPHGSFESALAASMLRTLCRVVQSKGRGDINASALARPILEYYS